MYLEGAKFNEWLFLTSIQGRCQQLVPAVAKCMFDHVLISCLPGGFEIKRYTSGLYLC
jgi:hypothetical protein